MQTLNNMNKDKKEKIGDRMDYESIMKDKVTFDGSELDNQRIRIRNGSPMLERIDDDDS